MGGVEAVLGGIHRHTVLDVISYYDKKYVEKWFLHDEAANLLALKSRAIFLKEHYTRLYGPRVAAARTGNDSWGNEAGGANATRRARVQTFVPQKGDDFGVNSICFKVDSEDDMKRLREAFEAHPYSKFSNKVADPDAGDKAFDDVVEHQAKRTSVLWDKAFSAQKRATINQRKSLSPIKTEFSPVEEEAEEDIEDIKQVYKGVRLQSQSSVDTPTEVPNDSRLTVEVSDDTKAPVEP